MANKWLPTPADLERLRELAEQRVNETEMAAALGISHQTWYTRKKEVPEIQEILDAARLSKVDFVRSKLMQIIEDPHHKKNFEAICYWLNRYDSEGQQGNEPDGSPKLPTGFTLTVIKPKDEE